MLNPARGSEIRDQRECGRVVQVNPRTVNCDVGWMNEWVAHHNNGCAGELFCVAARGGEWILLGSTVVDCVQGANKDC